MEIDGLTDEQNQALSYFREFTHIDSIETCRQYLEAHEWDVERAIETALVSNADLPSDTPNLHQSYTTDASTFDSAFGRDSSEPYPRPSAPPMPDNELPSASTRSVSNNQMNNPQNPNNSMSIVQLFMSFFYAIYVAIQSWIPWTIIQIVVSFFRSLIAGVQPADPLKEIDDYCAYFNQKYGRDHPAFYRGRLQQALSDARREVRLLFIYLHDKNSTRCDEFCREILCQDALRDLIGNHLLWSASIDTQEGLRASQVLRVRTYPCLCIVAHEGSQERLQFQMDHYTGADECLAEIFNAVQLADQTLEQNRERLNSRNSRNRLVEEQDAAYLDSMRADQEKAELRARQERVRLQLEEEQRRKQEEEERKLREFTEFRDRIRRELPAEPSPTETDIIQVSIRLPSAEPMRRRFRRSDPAKLLFEYAWTNSDVPNQFELLWGYPRKRYQYDQIGEKTIGDVIHANTETCYLEQIDDEK